MIKELDDKVARFKQMEEKSLVYNSWQEVLGVPPTIFDNIDELRTTLMSTHTMWVSL